MPRKTDRVLAKNNKSLTLESNQAAKRVKKLQNEVHRLKMLISKNNKLLLPLLKNLD